MIVIYSIDGVLLYWLPWSDSGALIKQKADTRYQPWNILFHRI
ncbi:hypothetical protein VCR14J2_20072 [Vibrio coralliirubri]|nr:hypothetical protein VCR1J2_210063 [Vibrio coralliirubri]CDT86963.1 hypothetical protein VCR26J2_440054 [Vibrio coralliirubri]CDT89607.1 hypothetical protein VCR8J2_30075 [Vibrio coralliirubri]CDT90196.1 hypothetical protein VCR14J2_20072 [Vibrio coralliirubri]